MWGNSVTKRTNQNKPIDESNDDAAWKNSPILGLVVANVDGGDDEDDTAMALPGVCILCRVAAIGPVGGLMAFPAKN